METTVAAFLPLLALCLLGFSTDALAERDVGIEHEADTIRIDAKLLVDVHHHIAWQGLTDYDNLARFVPVLLASCIVVELGAPLRFKQTGQSVFLWLALSIEVVVRIVEVLIEAILNGATRLICARSLTKRSSDTSDARPCLSFARGTPGRQLTRCQKDDLDFFQAKFV